MIRTPSILGCLVLATVGCGTAPPVPPAIEGPLHAAVRTAVEAARDDVRSAPRSASAWGDLAMVLDAHDLREEAAGCYRHAASLDPADPRWPYLLADVIEAADPDGAARLFRRVMRIAPGDVLASLRLAENRLASGDGEAAWQVLESLRQSAPDEPRLLMLLAVRLDAVDRTSEAIEYATMAAQLAPMHRGIRELQARLLYRHGRREEAATAAAIADRLPQATSAWPDPWREAVSRRRRDPHRASDEALARARQGDDEQGDRLLESLVRDHPDDWTFAAELARFRIRRGDAAGAESAADVDRHPDATELWKLRGASRLISENWRGAAADFQQAVARDASDAAAWSDLAYAHERLLDRESAIACLERAVSLEPLDEEQSRRLATLVAGRSPPSADAKVSP